MGGACVNRACIDGVCVGRTYTDRAACWGIVAINS